MQICEKCGQSTDHKPTLMLAQKDGEVIWYFGSTHDFCLCEDCIRDLFKFDYSKVRE